MNNGRVVTAHTILKIRTVCVSLIYISKWRILSLYIQRCIKLLSLWCTIKRMRRSYNQKHFFGLSNILNTYRSVFRTILFLSLFLSHFSHLIYSENKQNKITNYKYLLVLEAILFSVMRYIKHWNKNGKKNYKLHLITSEHFYRKIHY